MPRSLDELKAENERLTRVLDDGARAQLMALPDVVHVAVGLRERGGLATDEFTLKVFVDEKVAAAELPPDRMIPVAIANVGIDVCAVPTGRFHADDSRERPLVGGTQITNGIKVWESDAHTTSISGGTLGTVVYRRSDSAPAILTCWHVVTVHGGKEGDPLFQPAPNPDKTPDRENDTYPKRPDNSANMVATIGKAVVSAKIDGAIALVDHCHSWCCDCGTDSTQDVKGLAIGGSDTLTGVKAAVVGTDVVKVGRVTGRTAGKVMTVDGTANILNTDGITRRFTGQIFVQGTDKRFSEEGDSGAVIVNPQREIIGLLFAGEDPRDMPGKPPEALLTFVNHIEDVLTELDVFFPSTAKQASLHTSVSTATGETPGLLEEFSSRLGGTAPGRELLERFTLHRREVVELVNHHRRVTIAWHRAQGPAWLAAFGRGARRQGYVLPSEIDGVERRVAVSGFHAALAEHGSESLRADLREIAPSLLEAFAGCRTFDELVETLEQQALTTSQTGTTRSEGETGGHATRHSR